MTKALEQIYQKYLNQKDILVVKEPAASFQVALSQTLKKIDENVKAVSTKTNCWGTQCK